MSSTERFSSIQKRRHERSVRAALARLAKDIGDDDILDLPVVIVPEQELGGVAATGTDCIMLADTLVDKDSLNLEVYLAHEIYHDVVHEVELTHLFSAPVLNDAEDYLINSYLLEKYDYDVREVFYEGLFNVKYTGWSLYDIAVDVDSLAGTGSKRYFSNQHKPPLLLKITAKIKSTIGIVQEQSVVEPFYSDDISDYYESLKQGYTGFCFDKLPNVIPELLAKSIWTRFYSNSVKWHPEVINKHLTATQILTLCPVIDNSATVGDTELSLFCAKYLINSLNNASGIVHTHINKIRRRIISTERLFDKTISASATARSKRTRDKLAKRLTQLDERLERLTIRRQYFLSLVALTELLANRSVVRSRAEKVVHSLGFTLRTHSRSPKFEHRAPTVKMIRLVLKLAGDPSKLKSLYEQIDEFSKDFTGDGDEHTGEEDLSQLVDSDEGNGGEVETGESEASDEQTEPTGKKGPPKRKERVEQSGSETVSGNAPSDSAGNDTTKPSTKLQVLDTLAENPRVFKAILQHAKEFGEKLLSTSSTYLSDTGLVDRTLTFGNDLSKVATSELGRLGNQYTQLSFLVDLANSNLLQYSDTDPRRSPVILVLDCSGSMQGKFYELAAGFCFCLIRKLTIANRGIALIKFTSQVDNVFIWEGKTKVSLPVLLRSLATPNFGGTNFNQALTTAYNIHIRQGWARSQVLLVSDGYDIISPAVTLNKPKNCKVTAVLVNKKPKLVGVDECIQVERNNLSIELVKVGNRLM